MLQVLGIYLPPIDAMHRKHSGLSLLEVLVSMFILLFGLVGVASLFPVGKYHVQQAFQYDQASAVGQRAFEEIRVRGLLRPDRWNMQNGNSFIATYPTDWQKRAVFFDPLAVAAGSSNVLVSTVGNSTPLPRVTWRNYAGQNMTQASAEFIFKSHHDLKFELPSQRSSPPIQRITAIEREHDAAYSWGFLAVPVLRNSGEGYYRVSVVVFRNRKPGQEWGNLNPAGSEAIGQSVGETKVRVIGTPEQGRNIKQGEWVLLSQQGQNATRPDYFYWYKVISLVTLDADGIGQLQLQGVVRPTGFDNTVFTTIFASAVGVYEKTMMADSSTDWLID